MSNHPFLTGVLIFSTVSLIGVVIYLVSPDGGPDRSVVPRVSVEVQTDITSERISKDLISFRRVSDQAGTSGIKLPRPPTDSTQLGAEAQPGDKLDALRVLIGDPQTYVQGGKNLGPPSNTPSS
jgi:hypothetical protein